MEVKPHQGFAPKRTLFDGNDAGVQNIPANPKRLSISIQNLAEEALHVLRKGSGDSDASATNFDFVLPACTSAGDGTSNPIVFSDYSGAISLFATSGNVNAIVAELETI